MNIVIVEDEIPAAQMLEEMLLEADGNIKIEAILQSIAEIKNYFSGPKKKVDLIFMDIRLKNENSLDLLKEFTLPAPIIFVTAYDEFVMRAFRETSIDYVLKPISFEKINAALKKYHDLKDHFNAKVNELLQFVETNTKKYRERLLYKKGSDFFFIKAEDIAYLYTDQTLVFIVDFNNQRVISEYKTLGAVEEELDPFLFFRASRKYILNIKAIKKFRSIDRVKLSVELIFQISEEIIVSQENAANFKNWVGNRNI